MNFSTLCSVQVRKASTPWKKEIFQLTRAQSRSGDFSIAEVVIKVLFAIGHFVIYRKTRKGEKQNLADSIGGAGTDFLEDVL